MAKLKQLDAGEVSLNNVFSADYDFIIPDYQRPYAWGTEQALQLLDDLDGALDRDEDEPYFLGSIVLVKERGVRQAEVIDGQQRLTTLTILFSVLRDLASDVSLADELRELVLEPGRRLSGTKPKPRLQLRKRDAEFFRRWVQEPGRLAELVTLPDDALRTDTQRAIRDNAAALHSRLAVWEDQRREELATMMGSRTFLVVVSTPNLSSAHRIFSVMNARGLDLSASDIFKADIIGRVDDELRAEYADKWENEEEDLGRDNFADLFLHIRMIVAKVRARRELLKEFPEQVLNEYLPGRAAEFVDTVLLPYSDAYEILLDRKYASGPGSDEVNLWLQRLSQLDNNDWRPPALWALRHHGTDPAFLAEFLRRLERLAASMLLRRVYATPRSQRYGELLRQLDDDGRGLDAPAFRLDEAERADTVSRLRGDLHLVGPVRRYVLPRLDELLANRPGVTYHHNRITVEHVLPQNPRSDSEWRSVFTDDQRAEWTHKLANLVLLNRAKNSEAQNFDFAKKKAKYFTSSSGVATFALTTQVISHDKWTPDTLEERQEQLVAKLVDEWRLQGTPAPALPQANRPGYDDGAGQQGEPEGGTTTPRFDVRVIDSPEMADTRRRELDLSQDTARSLGVEAVRSIAQGWYGTADGRRVTWSEAVENAKRGTLSIPPERGLPDSDVGVFSETIVEVANETSLAAARRLVEVGLRPLVLNMANGVRPGGGFLNGARAQEESLCRSSALYATLVDDPMYAAHSRRPQPDSTDWVILSSDVPVFRHDDGTPLDAPWLTSFVTCAAPYAPRVGQPASGDLLGARIGRLLKVARAYGYTALVLGAWGCGAFANDADRAAQDFRRHLEDHAGAFEHVVFAIADWSPDRRLLSPFAAVFSS